LTEIPKSLLSSGVLQIPRVLRMSLTELLAECKKENVTELANTQKNYIAGVVIRARLQKHGFMLTDGCLEVLPEGFGFLRPSFNDYLPSADDVFVSQNLIRRYGLKTGHMVAGAVRPPRDNEKYLALARIDAVNDEDPNLAATKTPFEELTPLYPDERLTLETDAEILETRIVDLISPIGKGQRGLIVSPPRAGKTILLQKIANAISRNNPECHLLVLLVDERPEEVTDMERTIRGEVIASTFDEPASRHVQVAHMVIQKAKRLVEYGKDVVILLDSITRLARAHNIETPGSSKILSGGIDAGALQKPKQFFGAARNIEKGGSLTILGTALVDTGSRMDEVIFEEFKGTGNMELVLDRRLADRRTYPALDINMSGTRREDLLMNEDELQRVWILRRFMNDIVDPVEAMDLLLEKMRKAKTNAEFLLSINTDK
jgi:transcription termination factor Rho